jgi:hypothetical protein
MVNSNQPNLEPLAVSPKQATELLPIGITRLYELINSGEVESQLIGRRRWINYQSLKRFAGLA